MTDHAFSDELRKVLAKLDAHPCAKDRLPRKAYELETKCAALQLMAKDAEAEAARLFEKTCAQDERLELLQQRLESAESMSASLTRALERVQGEHEAAVEEGLQRKDGAAA